MSHKVLILGATGRTGGRVLTQLLEREVPVRAIVRSAERLPDAASGDPLLEVVEADLLALPPEVLAGHLTGCDTVISCLGHTISARGVFGPPRGLVTQAVGLVRDAVGAVQSANAAAAAADRASGPVRLILMSSVSVNQPGHADTRRGRAERAYMAAMRAAVPPARDNQRAADLLVREVGPADPQLQWVVVRPDTLTDGDVSQYAVHDELVASLFRPDHTRMANVGHFMCELSTDDRTWQRWRSRMPVVVDAAPAP
jgi:nucleoside-diphosphate-sugar epimerase